MPEVESPEKRPHALSYILRPPLTNITGSYYGNDYKNITATFVKFIQNGNPQHGEFFNIRIKIHPARFIKQVISMFMSVDDSADMRDFGSSLINKEEKVPFPENMKISMFISTGSISKLGGPFTTLLSADGVDAFSSEIITYSFGFTLSKGTDEYHKQFGCDITYMTKFSYEDEFEIVLTLPVVNTYAKLPLDYRNEDEFKNHKSALLHLV